MNLTTITIFMSLGSITFSCMSIWLVIQRRRRMQQIIAEMHANMERHTADPWAEEPELDEIKPERPLMTPRERKRAARDLQKLLKELD